MNDLAVHILVVCLQATGAECLSRSLIPYENLAQCEAARVESGLPKPDHNFAPAYKGQTTAYCISVNRLDAVEAPEPRRPKSQRTTYVRESSGRIVSFSF